MSANNGHPARFQIARKRKMLRRMRMRDVMIELKNKSAADAPAAVAAKPAKRRAGPALEAK